MDARAAGDFQLLGGTSYESDGVRYVDNDDLMMIRIPSTTSVEP